MIGMIILFASAVVAIPVGAVLLPKVLRPKIKIPGYGARMNSKAFSAKEVAAFLDRFIKGYESRWGASPKLRPAIDKLNIFWERAYAFEYPTVGRVTGLTPKPNTVYVGVGDRPIGRTSFGHECLHVALWAIKGNPGGNNHETWTKAHWDFIESLKEPE
jgi:hypothetical protein